jgi:hypothetical protein
MGGGLTLSFSGGKTFPPNSHNTHTTQTTMGSASAVDGICVGVIIDAVTVAVSITVAVFVTVTVANSHFFQDPFS